MYVLHVCVVVLHDARMSIRICPRVGACVREKHTQPTAHCRRQQMRTASNALATPVAVGGQPAVALLLAPQVVQPHPAKDLSKRQLVQVGMYPCYNVG